MMNHLFDRIKLLFRKDKELYSCLYKILGFYPHHIDLYRTAMMHKSTTPRGTRGLQYNNERLEFLGDAVLESIVSDIVYRRFAQKPEGFLTTTRSKIVQRNTLNQVAEEIGLNRLIKSEINSTAHNSYLAGNAFEALIGAIYLDRGYGYCFRFFEQRIINQHLDLKNLASREENYKSKLIEWCQKNRIDVQFSTETEMATEENAMTFKSDAMLENIKAGQGTGFSKKESQQNAAKEAFQRVRRNEKLARRVMTARDIRLKKDETAKDNTPTETTPVAGKPQPTAEPRNTRRRKKPATPQTERPEAAPVATVAIEQADAPATAPKSRRRRPARAKQEKPEELDREAIIRAAEEAAFREHTEEAR